MSNTAATTTIGTTSTGKNINVVAGRRYFSLVIDGRNFGTFAQFDQAAAAAARYGR